MTSPGMILIGDPARIGAAVEDICAILGISRRDLARALAARTGRSPDTWNSQLWSWGRRRSPNPASLGPVLDEIGYQLALVPLNEDGPTSGPASTLPAEEGDTGTEPRVDDPNGLTGLSGGEVICGHCGGPQRGYASIGDTPLCHPDEGLDCYRLVTVYGHGAPCVIQPCYDPHATGSDQAPLAGWVRPETQEA